MNAVGASFMLQCNPLLAGISLVLFCVMVLCFAVSLILRQLPKPWCVQQIFLSYKRETLQGQMCMQ